MRRVSISLALLGFVFAFGVSHAAEVPALYRIERKNADDLTVLRSSGIPIVQETRFSLFVLGGPADLVALAKRGYDAKLLDAETAGADYLMVGVRPDSDVDAIRRAGTVLFAEENLAAASASPPAWTLHVVHDAHALGRARAGAAGRGPQGPRRRRRPSSRS